MRVADKELRKKDRERRKDEAKCEGRVMVEAEGRGNKGCGDMIRRVTQRENKLSNSSLAYIFNFPIWSVYS